MTGTGWAGTGILAVLLAACPASRSADAAAEFKTVQIKSMHDGTLQAALLYLPPEADGKPVPLLVVLHTWSGNYKQKQFGNECLAEVNGKPEKKLSPEQISSMTKTRAVPPELATERVDEPGRKHKVLFRRQAGPARVTIFQGGHAGDMPTAVDWLAKKMKNEKGKRKK